MKVVVARVTSSLAAGYSCTRVSSEADVRGCYVPRFRALAAFATRSSLLPPRSRTTRSRVPRRVRREVEGGGGEEHAVRARAWPYRPRPERLVEARGALEHAIEVIGSANVPRAGLQYCSTMQ